MVYADFLMAVKTRMEQALGDDYELTLHRIPKNNGTVLDGLCIARNGSRIAPALYLNSCYAQYLDGCPLEALIEELLDAYQQNVLPPGLDDGLLSDFSIMKERITCRLIHRASNEALLEQLPHVVWLDLAVVFQLCLTEDDSSIMTALIRSSSLEAWDICADQLLPLALSNTRRLFPPSITSMEQVLEELSLQLTPSAGSHPPRPSSPAVPLYILSNRCGIHGAICMLYPNLLRHFSEGVERDLLILPSSIHEVLLLPADPEISCEELSRIVAQINQTEVQRQDRLSNQVYLYSQASDTVSLATCGKDLPL